MRTFFPLIFKKFHSCLNQRFDRLWKLVDCCLGAATVGLRAGCLGEAEETWGVRPAVSTAG